VTGSSLICILVALFAVFRQDAGRRQRTLQGRDEGLELFGEAPLHLSAAGLLQEFDNSLVESGYLLVRLVGQPAFESLDGSPQRLSWDTDGHLENLQGEVRRGGRQPLHSM